MTDYFTSEEMAKFKKPERRKKKKTRKKENLVEIIQQQQEGEGETARSDLGSRANRTGCYDIYLIHSDNWNNIVLTMYQLL